MSTQSEIINATGTRPWLQPLQSVPVVMEDLRLIKKVLGEQPENIKRMGVMDYVKVFKHHMNGEQNIIKRENKGRFYANTFLREEIWPTLR